MRGFSGRVWATAQVIFFSLTARTVPGETSREAHPGGKQAERPPAGEKAGLEGAAARAAGGARGGEERGPRVARTCTPWQIKGGFGHLAGRRGELELYFPGCLGLAGPAILFRLKREGFSACTVEASERGLLVRGTR